jgi:hypothetical protein
MVAECRGEEMEEEEKKSIDGETTSQVHLIVQMRGGFGGHLSSEERRRLSF